MATSTFTDETAAVICNRIAEGEGLRSICRDPDMPGRQTVLDWLSEEGPQFDAFRTKYARAREAQADFHDEEIQNIADTAAPENVMVAKLQIETRKWRASKLAPKKYGDKLDMNLGGQADNPVKASLEVTFVKPQ